nr:polyprenol phosphomannose-dependent alpha 1,6 mannosyltransferase MptB [Corynebacterium gerontici]
MLEALKRPLKALRQELPRIGTAGSRSTHLHVDVPEQSEQPQSDTHLVVAVTGADLLDPAHRERTQRVGKARRLEKSLSYQELRRFAIVRWMGTVGALLLGLGALGAGALPVRDNPYSQYPLGSLMGRMLQTSTIICFLGIGMLVLAWLFMAPFSGALWRLGQPRTGLVSTSMLRRTFIAWTFPILLSAPMFTQDIYSYLANGKIIRLGLDPYSAGPIDLLGTNDVLARSVPFIWAHSPSPYGPVGLGLATVISWVTNDSIVWGVVAHRCVSIAGVMLAAWGLHHLALRCKVTPQAAFWLGILNPISILHLIGGIHNEAIMLGCIMAGFEFGLRASDRIAIGRTRSAFWFALLGGFLMSCAGMVKVTGFIGLGFIGMAFARALHARGWSHWRAITCAAVGYLGVLVASIAVVTFVTGIPTGWITGQGGAVSIRSWMSITTAIGVISGWWGMVLDLGDHTEAILQVTRAAGLAVAAAFMIRMLIATYRGTIAAIGGLGVATFVLVIFFPVVHPWYMLWAIVPLSAWANRVLFRWAVTAYCALLSFFVLPRGLSLPPATVLSIYFFAALSFVVSLIFLRWLFNRPRRRGIH